MSDSDRYTRHAWDYAVGTSARFGIVPPPRKTEPIPAKVLKCGDVTVRILWPEKGRASSVEVNDCGGVWDGERVTRCVWSFGGETGRRVLETAARLIRKWEQR